MPNGRGRADVPGPERVVSVASVASAPAVVTLAGLSLPQTLHFFDDRSFHHSAAFPEATSAARPHPSLDHHPPFRHPPSSSLSSFLVAPFLPSAILGPMPHSGLA